MTAFNKNLQEFWELTKLLKRNPIKEWENVRMLLRTMLHDGRKVIATPEWDANLSDSENYYRQFETRIMFSGDILQLLPKEGIWTTAEMAELTKKHQRAVEDFVAKLYSIDYWFVVISGTITATSEYASVHYCYEELDWGSWLVGIAVFLFQYYFKDWITRKTMQVVTALVKSWLRNKVKLKKLFGAAGEPDPSSQLPAAP